MPAPAVHEVQPAVSAFDVLAAAHPTLVQAVAPLSIGRFPTPVESAPTLADALGLSRLYVKREDTTHPVVGGGKVRKLEVLLADAKRRGATRVVAFGGVGSNQAVATALLAAPLDFEVELVLLPQPPTDGVRRRLIASEEAGALIQLMGTKKQADRWAASLAPPPEGPYLMPWGGTSALGNVAFIAAAFELAAQVRAGQLEAPDYLYVPFGTMGTALGLAIGLHAANIDTEVVAVRASNHNTSSRQRLRELFDETTTLLEELDPGFPRADLADLRLSVDGQQLGAGYAQTTAASRDAERLYEAATGRVLDPTYEAKTVAAIRARAAAHQRANDVVLLWLTGPGAHLPDRQTAVETWPGALQPYVRQDGTAKNTTSP